MFRRVHEAAGYGGCVSIGKVAYIVRRNPDRVWAAETAFIRQKRVPPRAVIFV
jgi:hypothetical protein